VVVGMVSLCRGRCVRGVTRRFPWVLDPSWCIFATVIRRIQLHQFAIVVVFKRWPGVGVWWALWARED